MFGSKKREREKLKLAGNFRDSASETQKEIDFAKTQNPFESAAAKSARASVAKNSMEFQTRLNNMLGAGASAESAIAAQGQANQAAAAAEGNIAVGSEANKNNQVNALRGLKEQQMGTYAGVRSSAIDEKGSGWSTLFQGMEALGGLMEGGGKAAATLMTGGMA